MKLLFVLIPISLIIVAFAIYIFRWALKNNQFDDLSSPALIPLLDDTEEELAMKNEQLAINDQKIIANC